MCMYNRWKVHHSRAQAYQFCLPPIVEDNLVYSAVISHHFETAYTARNCHHYCIVDKELCITPPEIPVKHYILELHVNRILNSFTTFPSLLVIYFCIAMYINVYVIISW